MVIDAHAHMRTRPQDLERMVDSGIIQQAWVMNNYYDYDNGNPDGHITEKELLSVCREYKDFFIPFGFLDFRKPPSIVDELKDRGFFGLKAIRPPKPYDSPEYFPYYERAQEHNMPILFHTGIIAKRTRQEVGEQMSLGPMNMKPAMLGGIAMEFPALTVIGGHLGWPWMEETKQNLDYYPNIYHDISSGHIGYFLKWMIDNLDMRCHDGVHRYLTDKLLFAVDAMYGRKEAHDRIFRTIKFWELFFEIAGKFHCWGEKAEIEKICRGNAEKILKSAGYYRPGM